MTSREENTLKEILKKSLQHLPRLLTFCNIGTPDADTGRWWGASPSPPVKFANNEREKRERKKKGKRGRKKKEKRERERERERQKGERKL